MANPEIQARIVIMDLGRHLHMEKVFSEVKSLRTRHSSCNSKRLYGAVAIFLYLRV